MVAAYRTRLIVTVYDDEPEVRVEGPGGFTSDRAILEILANITDRAIGEWRLWRVGRGPDGLRLIRTVAAEGLDGYPHTRVEYPLADAALQWSKMDLPTRMSAVHDYRTVSGRVIRARKPTPAERLHRLARAQAEASSDQSRPIGVDAQGDLIYRPRPSLEDAPARGPYSNYPRSA